MMKYKIELATAAMCAAASADVAGPPFASGMFFSGIFASLSAVSVATVVLRVTKRPGSVTVTAADAAHAMRTRAIALFQDHTRHLGLHAITLEFETRTFIDDMNEALDALLAEIEGRTP